MAGLVPLTPLSGGMPSVWLEMNGMGLHKWLLMYLARQVCSVFALHSYF